MRRLVALFALFLLCATRVGAQEGALPQSHFVKNVYLYFNYDTNGDSVPDGSYKLPVTAGTNSAATFYVDKNGVYADAAGTMQITPNPTSGTRVIPGSWGLAVVYDKSALSSLVPQPGKARYTNGTYTNETLTTASSYFVKFNTQISARVASTEIQTCVFDSAFVPFQPNGSDVVSYASPTTPGCMEALFAPDNFDQSGKSSFVFDLAMSMRITGKNRAGADETSKEYTRRDKTTWGGCIADPSLECALDINTGEANGIYPNFDLKQGTVQFQLNKQPASSVLTPTCTAGNVDNTTLTISQLTTNGFPLRMVFEGKTIEKTQTFLDDVTYERLQSRAPMTFYINKSGNNYFISTKQGDAARGAALGTDSTTLFNLPSALNEIVAGDKFVVENLNLQPGEKPFEVWYEPIPSNVLPPGQQNLSSGNKMCESSIVVDEAGNVTTTIVITQPVTPTPPLPISQGTSLMLCETIQCDSLQNSKQKQQCEASKNLCMKCGGTDASNELQKQITQLENEIANMPPSPARTAMVAELTALRSQMGTLQQTYVWTGIGCMSTQFSTLMTDALRALGGIMGLFILWCIVSNGFKIMVSRGNPEALKKAQEEITSCVVGFIVLMFSVVILRIIGVNILALPFLR